MLNRVINCVVFITFVSLSGWSQTIEFEHTVKVKFEDVPLFQVLETMTKMYDFKFSYVPEKMPLQQRVFWNPVDAPNQQNVEDFLNEQHIQFIKIGDQYVLRYKETQENLVDVSEFLDEAEFEVKDEVFTPRPQFEITLVQSLTLSSFDIPYQYNPTPKLEKDLTPPQLDDASQNALDIMAKEGAQISLFPGVGTTQGRTDQVNKASINLLYGRNGGVDGFEVGVGVNYIENDVKGVQIAGLANIVGDKVTGFQGASVYNKTKNLDGVQLSGTLNVVSDTLEGMQFSAFGNLHHGDKGGFQFATFFNTSRGRASSQLSTFYNQAESIDGLQTALVNSAGHVGGIQIGLVNFADSVSGASVGFLNFIKKGYNHIEVYNTEALYATVSLTFGSRRFYNRLLFGASSYDQHFVWGLGYGVGTNIRLTEKNALNIDLHTMHINADGWSTYVNFLNTLSFTLTTDVSDKVKFFIGPSANLYIKERSNLFTGIENSVALVPDIFPYYAKYQEDPARDNIVKGWVGWKAGFRF